MSTRSNIIIQQRTNNETHYVQIYRHFDGYPDGAGKELARILSEFINRTDKNDIYSSPISLAEEITKQDDSFEIEFQTTDINEINLHADIEYFYVIDMNLDVLEMKEFISKELREYAINNKSEINSYHHKFYDDLNNWQYKPYKDIYEEAVHIGTIPYGFPLKEFSDYIDKKY